MNNDFGGNEVLQLLKDIDSEPMIKDVKDLYEVAYERRIADPERAIEYCERALTILEVSSQSNRNSIGFAYARGKFHLLIASIYLSMIVNLKNAERHYRHSQNEFHQWQWKHLESLAYLGLAITWRKLGDFYEAMNACKSAQDCVNYESIPSSINTSLLREAIKEERLAIQKLSLLAPLEGVSAPLAEASTSLVQEKSLQIYYISTGEGLITAGGTTDLNLLSCEDYMMSAFISPEKVIIDLNKHQKALEAACVLEIDENIDIADDGMGWGDWLFLQTETDPYKLNGKTVAVLTRENDEIYVSLKIFVNAEDHYFLKAKSKNAASIVVAHYRTDLSGISNYYGIDGKNVIAKRVYDIHVSGVIIDHIPQKSVLNIVKAFLWQIPIVSNIAAGLGHPITEENIVEYVEIRRGERRDVNYFGVVVTGDSMAGDNIFPGDIALIHQQPTVKNGEIAAIVIFTPDIEPLGVLKHYYVVYEKREDLRHWLLESSNPSSEHIVVTPSGVNTKEIENLYIKRAEAGKIVTPKFYKDAEIAIAGKYVGLVRKDGTVQFTRESYIT